MAAKPRIVVLGEKPQGAMWLEMALESGLFEVVAGVPRFGGQRWWGWDGFEQILKDHRIPIVHRADLVSMEYDILWSMMYGFIIEAEHINRAKWFGLNLHESPLPRYRGCNGYTHSILENDTTYGTTFHFLTPELDQGEIIKQEIFPILRDETAKELYVRTLNVSKELFHSILPRVAAKDLPSIPNDTANEPIRPRSSLVELKQLSLPMDLDAMYVHARAFDFLPFEPAFFRLKERTFYAYVPGSEARGTPDRELPLPKATTLDQAIAACEKGVGALITSFARPLCFLEKQAYARMYPLFIPQYSWLKKGPAVQ